MGFHKYLDPEKIQQFKVTDAPRWGMTVDGYTVRSGAPTSIMIQLVGEKRWRRVMCWQFSNAGTMFIRISGEPFIIRDGTFFA